MDTHLMYQAAAARRTQVDATMWQVPAMSFAGQAFLLSIALAADSPATARSIAAGLAVVVSVMSMQLMARLRRLEFGYSDWLQEYEKTHFGESVHGTAVRDGLKSGRVGGILGGRGSFNWWMVGLGLFGLAGISVLILVAARPSLLGAM